MERSLLTSDGEKGEKEERKLERYLYPISIGEGVFENKAGPPLDKATRQQDGLIVNQGSTECHRSREVK